MTSSTFLIGPTGDGLRKDLKPWATPEDSFDVMVNAYQFRGRIVRRSGYTLLGQLANGTPVMGLRTQEQFNVDQQSLIAFDTTQAYRYNGTNFVALPSVMPVTWSGTDSQFFYSTNYAGAFWATNSKPGLNGWPIQSFGGSAGTGTSATVNVTAAGNTVAVNDQVYFGNVTGIPLANNLVFGKVTAIITPGSEFTVQATSFPKGFTSFSNGSPTTGIVMDSMQAVTTPTAQDGIRYYGVLSNGTGWANYNPPLNATAILAGALLIFPYRGYLVFLNTWEGNDGGVFNFGNRARWMSAGTPYYSAPQPIFPNVLGINPEAGRDDLFGAGGATDAPTNEVIVAAAFIRDILVVYFERSTWRLRFVNNAQNPFVWERINVELGSSSTFSAIPFDKGLMAIGDRGIVISDGNDTVRIDQKIPDEFFNIRQTNNGYARVQGIRTFRSKLNFWTIPSENNPGGIYPDYVLVYNWDTANWSYFDDQFTCFGYFYPGSTYLTWADLPNDWSSYTDVSWDSGVAGEFEETIVAGNQQGYVFQLEVGGAENDPSLTVSNITTASPGVFTSSNNNLSDGTWISLIGVTGSTSTDGVSLNGRSFKLSNPTLDPDNFYLYEFTPIDGGIATGTLYTFTINYKNIIPGSIVMNIGTMEVTDNLFDGVLAGTNALGTINYLSGFINLAFIAAIPPTHVYIRVVTYDPDQDLSPVNITGAYGGGGQIIKISGYNVQSKFFNFFKDNQRARLSKIDFYVNQTQVGQFTCNVFADSSNQVINTPLSDNFQSNVVLTSRNPYQIGQGVETITRLFCDAMAQTLQFQFTLVDQQLAVQPIAYSDIEIVALMVTMRRGGRLV